MASQGDTVGVTGRSLGKELAVGCVTIVSAQSPDRRERASNEHCSMLGIFVDSKVVWKYNVTLFISLLTFESKTFKYSFYFLKRS